MKFSYNKEENRFTVDMKDEIILVDGSLSMTNDDSMPDCDCEGSVVHSFEGIIDVNKITVWNLLFDGELKRALKKIKKNE